MPLRWGPVFTEKNSARRRGSICIAPFHLAVLIGNAEDDPENAARIAPFEQGLQKLSLVEGWQPLFNRCDLMGQADYEQDEWKLVLPSSERDRRHAAMGNCGYQPRPRRGCRAAGARGTGTHPTALKSLGYPRLRAVAAGPSRASDRTSREGGSEPPGSRHRDATGGCPAADWAHG